MCSYRNSALENRIHKSRNVSAPRRNTGDKKIRATLSNDETNSLVDMNQRPNLQGSGFELEQDNTLETSSDSSNDNTEYDHNIVLGTGSDETPYMPVDLRSLFCVKKINNNKHHIRDSPTLHKKRSQFTNTNDNKAWCLHTKDYKKVNEKKTQFTNKNENRSRQCGDTRCKKDKKISFDNLEYADVKLPKGNTKIEEDADMCNNIPLKLQNSCAEVCRVVFDNMWISKTNVALKLRLKHVREQTFSECSQILDSIMTYCDAKARNTGQRQKVIGEGRAPRTGAGCGEGLCGGYTPSGWNKLKTIGAMDTCPDILPDDTCGGGGAAGSDRSQARAPPAGGPKANMHIGEGSEAARSGVSGASTSNSKFRPSARLLGEMAFQLERRVLDYVFGLEGAKKRRFYGYTVSNICYMMEKESTSPDGGSDVIGRTEMTCRLRKILCALEKYGYDIKIHADFSQEIINKYGLLPSPPDDKTIQTFGLNDACTIACLISRLSKRQSEVHNLNILLNCLHFLSKCDGRPLFVW